MKLSPESARAGIEGIASGLIYDLTVADRTDSAATRAECLSRAARRSDRAFAWALLLREKAAAPAGQRMARYTRLQSKA